MSLSLSFVKSTFRKAQARGGRTPSAGSVRAPSGPGELLQEPPGCRVLPEPREPGGAGRERPPVRLPVGRSLETLCLFPVTPDGSASTTTLTRTFVPKLAARGNFSESRVLSAFGSCSKEALSLPGLFLRQHWRLDFLLRGPQIVTVAVD